MLPDAVAAQDDQMVGAADLDLHGVGHGDDTHLVAPEVAEGARHVQLGAAGALLVHPIAVSVIGDGTPSLVDALRLRREVRLVVWCQITSLPLRAGGDRAPAVADVRDRQSSPVVVQQGDSGRRARLLRLQFATLVRLDDLRIHLREGVPHNAHHIRRAPANSGVLQNELRKVHLHIVGHIVAVLPVTIEHAIQREACAGAHHNPRVLVRALRFLPLHAYRLNARRSPTTVGRRGIAAEGAYSPKPRLRRWKVRLKHRVPRREHPIAVHRQVGAGGTVVVDAHITESAMLDGQSALQLRLRPRAWSAASALVTAVGAAVGH
mmetsp:Transcript_65422/g.188482  ORF Transcript_65422/g.188482 Transcript_65422/m.188482 type:complete len:321 (+) Transcript_65422:954-1916(+)